MGSVYILSHHDFNRLKIGYSTQDMKGLYGRYVTSFGKDVEFITFSTPIPVKIERQFQKKFKDKCITNELYKKEYLEEYIYFLKIITNEEHRVINSETLRNMRYNLKETSKKEVIVDDPNNNPDISPKHSCPRCHYSTTLKGDMLRHLQKKNTCGALYSDVSVDELLQKLQQPKKYKCNWCEKSFSHTSSLCKHKKEKHFILWDG